MKSQSKVLAEVLSAKTYFDLDEISDIIEVHFKIWQSEQFNHNLNSNNIVRQRNYLLSQKSQIEMQRNAIEKQLSIARSRLKSGINTEAEIVKMNFMFHAKKAQLATIQNDLSNLKTYEKAKNIKESNIIERQVKDKVFELIKNEKGEEYAEQIFKKAEKLVNK